MQNTKIFDFLIIGCGPWGAAITMSLHKKNYKVLCIEKNLSFSGLAKTTNNMKFHSKLATLQLDNMNKLLMLLKLQNCMIIINKINYGKIFLNFKLIFFT